MSKNNESTTKAILNAGFSPKLKINEYLQTYMQTDNEVLKNPALSIAHYPTFELTQNHRN